MAQQASHGLLHGYVDPRRLRTHPRQALEKLRTVPRGLAVVEERPVFAAVATDPEVVRTILTHEAFRKGPATLRYRYALGDGTATSSFPPDGSRAYAPAGTLAAFRDAKRRFLAPAFDAERLAAHIPAVRELAYAACRGWWDGVARDIYAGTSELMVQIMLRCLFRRSQAGSVRAAGHFAVRSSGAVNRSIRSSPRASVRAIDRGYGFLDRLRVLLPNRDTRMLRRRQRLVRQAVEELLQTPPDDGEADDLVSLLRRGRYPQDGQGMSRAQIYHALIGLLFAGYENSAAAAAWTLWCLAQHPEAQERLAAEVSRGVRDDSTQLHRLPYLQACVHESLRLYPPVWSMAREAVRETTLNGEDIPTGSVLIVSPWVQHQRPDSWEEPQRFVPARFLGRPPPVAGSYFPFGLGPRTCLGMSFGLMEVAVTVATIVEHTRIEPAQERPAPRPWLAATQRPAPGVFLRLLRR